MIQRRSFCATVSLSLAAMIGNFGSDLKSSLPTDRCGVSYTRSYFMSYGASLVSGYRQVGLYVGALLKGAKVSELPVIQPSTFTLAINLRAARAIG